MKHFVQYLYIDKWFRQNALSETFSVKTQMPRISNNERQTLRLGIDIL